MQIGHYCRPGIDVPWSGGPSVESTCCPTLLQTWSMKTLFQPQTCSHLDGFPHYCQKWQRRKQPAFHIWNPVSLSDDFLHSADHLKLDITHFFDLQSADYTNQHGGFSNNLREPETKSLKWKVDVHNALESATKYMLPSIPSKPWGKSCITAGSLTISWSCRLTFLRIYK